MATDSLGSWGDRKKKGDKEKEGKVNIMQVSGLNNDDINAMLAAVSEKMKEINSTNINDFIFLGFNPLITISHLAALFKLNKTDFNTHINVLIKYYINNGPKCCDKKKLSRINPAGAQAVNEAKIFFKITEDTVIKPSDMSLSRIVAAAPMWPLMARSSLAKGYPLGPAAGVDVTVRINGTDFVVKDPNFCSVEGVYMIPSRFENIYDMWMRWNQKFYEKTKTDRSKGFNKTIPKMKFLNQEILSDINRERFFEASSLLEMFKQKTIQDFDDLLDRATEIY